MNKKSYLSLIAIMLCALIPSQGALTVNDSLFSSVKDNLVLIETDVASGSGFICGSWLITNEHVIRDAKNIVARYLSGGLVKFAHPKEAVVEKNRNAAKQKALTAHLEECGIDIKDVLPLYKVVSVADITERMHENIINHISDIKEAVK